MTSLLTPYQRSLRFTRSVDRKVFTVTFYSHWTDIVSADGEIDCVKWFGDEDYISQRGFTYVKTIAKENVDG
jgi:hypothetical protein